MAEAMRLAVLDDYQDAAASRGPWERLGDRVALTIFRDGLTEEDALAARLRDFDAIMLIRERTPFPRSLLQRLPGLRLLITAGGRNRSVDAAACEELGITFCGTPSVGAPTLDLTWGLIIGLLRDIPGQQQALREGRWQTGIGQGLEGLTLGVLGLGHLGSRVAGVARAFGMTIIAWSPNLTRERAEAAGATLVERHRLFAEADVVSIHMVLSERTRGLVGAAELGAMKPSALLVNTSRGPLVEQTALVEALRSGRIAGAGLDVYDTEPLPADHPLLSCPNTLLTPHLGYVTDQNYRAYFTGAVEAVEAFLAGSPIRRIAAG
ncbi:D-2-hydroxyacid dehydrogenase family protein [Roseomonas gilardii subsp. gilardii]|uniref:D-2-hydroxyacid dehydrogenase family protein n=1 Tax=Roseomonas gilardii TaxID=257708 RepID=UPI001FF7E22E|nr:D-2-hydroxyacid dehydrogenase family protein [Roseomonas gilardii]UPG71519.1 D-2-hydroxyacid dehydrogenase family protein [Roseomonas gilardii subsp. gilardii]